MVAGILDQIGTFLAPITPFVEIIVLFILPIYIQLGEFFVGLSNVFLDFLPSDSYIMSFIIMGVIIVLGFILGVMSDKKKDDD
jgi:hypothetical protein